MVRDGCDVDSWGRDPGRIRVIIQTFDNEISLIAIHDESPLDALPREQVETTTP